MVQAHDRGCRGDRGAGGARAGAVRPRLGVRDSRAIRRGRLLGARSGDLRGAGKSRAAGRDPQQPRRNRLLPGQMDRGGRLLRAGRTSLGAVGRPLVGVLCRRQPGRSPARPGTAGRGGAADAGVAADRESIGVRPAYRGDGAVPRAPACAGRTVRRGAAPVVEAHDELRACRRVERGVRHRGAARPSCSSSSARPTMRWVTRGANARPRTGLRRDLPLAPTLHRMRGLALLQRRAVRRGARGAGREPRGCAEAPARSTRLRSLSMRGRRSAG